MYEQKKREKVINNLEYHIHLLYDVIPHMSRDDGEYLEATAKTMSDAIALLKAQEPRVMTLEEYDAWTDIPFTERDPVFHEERTMRGSITCWVNTGVCSLREYGKNDRCWTSRPDQATMEATPWN